METENFVPKTIDPNFTPDEELVTFAKYFSDNYKELEAGEYFSENKKHHIKYLEEFVDENTNQKSMSGARFSKTTKITELDKSMFSDNDFTPDFVFYIIIWIEFYKRQVLEDALELADIKTLEYYLTTGRSKKNLSLGYIKIFSYTDMPRNKDRFQYIETIADNTKK